MNSIIKFIKDFHNNSGSWIASATFINKFILFIIKTFVIVTLEKEILGQVTYAITIISYFTSFVGLGSPSGLLFYGSIAKSDKERKDIINYSFSQGLINTLFIIILIFPFLLIFSKGDNTIYLFLCILLIRIIALFLNTHQSAQLRVEGKNKACGIYDIINSIIYLIFAFTFTFLFYATGYLVALVSAPIVTFLIHSFIFGFPKWNLKWIFDFNKWSFWKYSILTSFSSVITQMVFFLDITLIGVFMDNKAVAEYSVASLIPFNVLVLPVIFMRTDYAKIASNHKNKAFLKEYYANFLKLFSIISILGLLVSYFFGEWIFSFLGKEYQPFNLFMYLIFAVCISMMFRVPLGNMIAAFGKAKFNTISGIITLIFSAILNLILIPNFGLYGAVWATCISLIVSSILNLAYFIWYLKNECE